ncbi:hypothetical protein [Micromonospora sp. WMMD1082]|uniref:hypothetical protein n=1 Tax=Micromonospora sp. WMMD1082 TaxID=3016104 RepID=UPI002417AA6C|nr:hypothetical protein [Micromonospora sp. WMMD1082]MDG4795092.1 hypothetical protein [Micromonospora sp. WMMD1082]
MPTSLDLDKAQALVVAAFIDATRDTHHLGELAEQPWRDAYRRRQLGWLDAAGLIAAHAIRLHAVDLVDRDDSPPLWAFEVAEAGNAIGSDPTHDPDRRAVTAMAIRRAISRGPAGDPDAEPGRTLAGWLFPNADADAAAAHLAAHVLAHALRYRKWWGRPAWYAAFGLDLLDVLTEDLPAVDPAGGRPRREEARQREALRVAVAGVHAARIATKARIAEAAGISRPTLDSWLAR